MGRLPLLLILLWHLSPRPGCHVADARPGPQEMKAHLAGAAREGREWRAATYRGLTVGKSTRSDALRVLGRPKWSEPPEGEAAEEPNPEVWDHYEKGGEVEGELIVGVDKGSGVIVRLLLHPERLTREEAIRRFGDDYLVTRYDFDDCLGDGESSPLYESPGGPVERVEYRGRGIVITSNYRGEVETIEYVAQPVGTPSSRCRGSEQAPRVGAASCE